MKKLVIILAGLMAGCANPKFDCPLQEGGVKCASLKKVSNMVKRGEINDNGVVKTDRKKRTKERVTVVAQTSVINSTDKFPRRVPEKTLDVWLAPYEAGGIYHQENFLTIVTTPAQWVGK